MRQRVVGGGRRPGVLDAAARHLRRARRIPRRGRHLRRDLVFGRAADPRIRHSCDVGGPNADILKLVLREGLVVTVIGLVIGIGGALASTGLIQNQLFGVSRMDPMTIAGWRPSCSRFAGRVFHSGEAHDEAGSAAGAARRVTSSPIVICSCDRRSRCPPTRSERGARTPGRVSARATPSESGTAVAARARPLPPARVLAELFLALPAPAPTGSLSSSPCAVSAAP